MSSKTRILSVDRDHPDPMIVADAGSILRSGGLVAFGTETVYGLGADATNPAAVARIYEAKGRPSFNPLIVHVDSQEHALACVTEFGEKAKLLAHKFWPGPLTLVLPRSGFIPDITAGGLTTVGVRIPLPEVAQALIRELGRPIAAPSANRSNRISPTLASHVVSELDGRIDLILDSGPCTVGLESTVLDLSSSIPRILRPGMVLKAEIEAVLGEVVLEGGTESGPILSPGSLPVHYAPQTPCVLVSREELGQIDLTDSAVIGFGEFQLARVPSVLFSTPQWAGEHLYDSLHKFDSMGLRQIVITEPPDEPEWAAVRDRVRRAAKRLV